MKKLLASLLFLTSLSALEYRPWLPEPFAPELKASYTLENYNKLAVKSNPINYSSINHLLSLGAGMGIWYESSYDLQFEVNCAGTKQHTFGFEETTLMGRIELANGISGASPVTVTAGAQLSYVRNKYIRDLSLCHHGKWDFFGHFSVGKECSSGRFWTKRLWGLVGLGSADKGSLWLDSRVYYEQNRCDQFFYGVFTHGLMGFGSHTLDPLNFSGYGSVRHRSVDIGGFFQYNLNYNGWVKIEYIYRPWAENFQTNLHGITAAVYYPL